MRWPSGARWIEAGALLGALAAMDYAWREGPAPEVLPGAVASRLARGATWREVSVPTSSWWCRRAEDPTPYLNITWESCPIEAGAVIVRQVPRDDQSRYCFSASATIALPASFRESQPFCTLAAGESGSCRRGELFSASVGGITLLRCVEGPCYNLRGPSTERLVALRPRRTPTRWAVLALGWAALVVAVASLWRAVARDAWLRARRVDGRWRLDDGRDVRVEGAAGDEVFVELDAKTRARPYREGVLTPARVATPEAVAELRRAARDHGFWRVVYAACAAALAALAAWSLR